MGWELFLHEREAHRAHRIDAARALLDGDRGPAAALLDTWRFAARPELVDALLDTLVAGGFHPSPQQLTASLGPADAIREPAEDFWSLSPLARRVKLTSLCAPSVEADAVHISAWALDELRFFGALIEDRQRRAWQDAAYPPDRRRDAETAALWAEWFEQSAWNCRERWEALYLPVAARAFGAVLEARQFPLHVRHQVQEDLQESFFFTLLGGGEGPPGWQELAVRVLETGRQGPVDTVTGCLDEAGWGRVGSCAVRRGYGPRSAGVAWPDLPNALARARALSDEGQTDPLALERYLDLHVALRLLDTWTEPDRCGSIRSWRVVRQNRGRASGRLRAVLASSDAERLRAPLMALDALHARTLSAVARHCRDWAWQQLSRGFSFDYGRSVSPPCLDDPDGQPPYSVDDLSALRCWVMLVIVRGRLGHLQRWVQEGSTGDRDTQWGRLLAKGLPDRLRDQGEGARGRYDRLRAELAEAGDTMLRELTPIATQIAALDGTKGAALGQRFTALLEPIWTDDVTFPKVRYKGYVENTVKALPLLELDEVEEDAHEH
ncbi:MAG: hypothetical protein H6739_10560 [Alphaproteobacteria bacterium]|nr:hypothetical protein [Alphaproteobacteria bacterium]